jgi:uncharacterized protein YgbK (DUF1537 family)
MSSVPYTAYGLAEQGLDDLVDAMVAREGKARSILFDVADASHLLSAGRQLDRQSRRASVLAVGSSVVVQALAAWWAQAGADNGLPVAGAAATPRAAPSLGPVFALAGSMSPVTARQVARAECYQKIPLNGAGLLRDAAYVDTQLARIGALLNEGRHVLAYVEHVNGEASRLDPGQLAFATADFIKRVVGERASNGTPLQRLGVAGGDTSSRAAKALDIWALSFVDVLAPGVALCRAHSNDPQLNGLQLMLKGGQMGGDDIFERLLLA